MNIGQVLEYLMTNSCCLGSLNINNILKNSIYSNVPYLQGISGFCLQRPQNHSFYLNKDIRWPYLGARVEILFQLIKQINTQFPCNSALEHKEENIW